MNEPARKTTRKKPKAPIKEEASPKEPAIFVPSLIFDPKYVREQLIPHLDAVVLHTELGGDVRMVSQFRFPGGMGGYVFGLYRFDVKNHEYNSAIPQFLLSIGFTINQIIELRRGGELTKIRINAFNDQLAAALQNPAHQAVLRRLNETWANGLVADLQRMLSVLEQANPMVAHQIFNNPDLQLCVLEYANQCGNIQAHGLLERWLSGEPVAMTKPLVPGQELSLDDLRDFITARRHR